MFIIGYLERSLETFVRNPPSTDFQRGYKACLEEILRVVKENPKSK